MKTQAFSYFYTCFRNPFIPLATTETPIHHPCTSQILCLYPPTSEKSWNKRKLVSCKITFEFQFYSVGIPRDLQSCTISTNQRRKVKAKQEYIPAKELLACYVAQACIIWKGKSTYTCLMGTWQSSGRVFLTLWPPIQSWLDFHAQKKRNPEGQWIWTTCLYLIRSKSWCTILFP